MFLRFKKKTSIQALEQGKSVVVEGRVVPRREMTVPGTTTKCVYYWVLNEKYTTGSRGRGRKMWVPSNQQEKTEGFFVEDDTGRAWIAESSEALRVTGGTMENGQLGKKASQRYLARFIRGGDTVRVAGLVDRPRGAEPGDLLVIRPDAKGRLRIICKGGQG